MRLNRNAGGGDLTAVRVDAKHLPGVVSELMLQLHIEADELEAYSDLREAAVQAARVRTIIDALDQIGWQTTRGVTVRGNRDALNEIFERVRHSARRGLDEEFVVDDAQHHKCDQALNGAVEALLQLEGAAAR